MATYRGHGIQLLMGSGDPVQYTAIAQIETIQPLSWTRETETIATHDEAPGNLLRKIAAALADGGQVTFTIAYDPNDPTHDALEQAKFATEPTPFRVIYPMVTPPKQVDFLAWVTSFTVQDTAANLSVLRADVTLDVTAPLDGSGS